MARAQQALVEDLLVTQEAPLSLLLFWVLSVPFCDLRLELALRSQVGAQMRWLFPWSLPVHLLEKIDAPSTVWQTCGEQRPGLRGNRVWCMPVGLLRWPFPLPAAGSHPPAAAWLFSSSLEVLGFTAFLLCTSRRIKGSRPWAPSHQDLLAPQESAGESCLLGCFHHYESSFFNSLPVFPVKTGIENFHVFLSLHLPD